MLLCFLCLVIACSLTFTEIEKDWEWLQRNLSDTLNSFDSEGDVTDFVCCKIQSVIANNIPDNQGIDGMSCSMISTACFIFFLCSWFHASQICIINVQQDATICSLYFILLQDYSACFGCFSHPSSGVHETEVTATCTSHISR